MESHTESDEEDHMSQKSFVSGIILWGCSSVAIVIVFSIIFVFVIVFSLVIIDLNVFLQKLYWCLVLWSLKYFLALQKKSENFVGVINV